MSLRIVAAAVAVNVVLMSAAFALDAKLPAYQTAADISGQIKSVGSDTLANAMVLWAKGFMDKYPGVKIDIESKGSATAPPALLSGAAQFGPMSRAMTSEELGSFRDKYGYDVAGFRVGIDALAVYVNKDNPIQCLDLPQLNRIFSSTRLVNGGRDVRTWGGAGLTGDWASQPIALFGRNDLSGTYEFFRDMTMHGGDFKPELKEQPSSEAVVQNVATDKYAIGYSGIGYKTDGVRTVPLASYPGGQCYSTSLDDTLSGRYPLARYLYIHVNKKPNQSLDPLRSEFIKYIVSKDGQTQTEAAGYYSITNDNRLEDLKMLSIANLLN